MRRLLIGLVVAAAAAAALAWFARSDAVRTADRSEEPGLAVQRSMLHPGMITLFARNDGADAVRIAQVMVNDAYVDFRARGVPVAPRREAEVDVFYPWVEGESYEIGLLTTEGAIVEYELEDAGAT